MLAVPLLLVSEVGGAFHRFDTGVELPAGEDEQARREAFEAFVLPGCGSPLVVMPDVCFVYPQDPPAGFTPGEGLQGYQKYLYARLSGPEKSGPEHDCAAWLDVHPLVEVWVRNLPGDEEHAFWLPIAGGRYYPTFTGRLVDGRIFAVEVTAEEGWMSAGSKERRLVGEVWDRQSNGKCLFVMARGTDWGAIDVRFSQKMEPLSSYMKGGFYGGACAKM